MKFDYSNEVKCGLIRENEDGSAVYWFDFNEEEKQALIRLGIITAIKNGIEEAKKYHEDFNENAE